MSIKQTYPQCSMIAVEPQDFDDTKRSIATGTHQKNHQTNGSICDALLAQKPGEITLPILRHYIDDVAVVKDNEVVDTMKIIADTHKMITEPGGAVAVCAFLTGLISGKETRKK